MLAALCPLLLSPCDMQGPACSYNVRFALLDLSRPPRWFQRQASMHMALADARQAAGTAGALLAHVRDMTCVALGGFASQLSMTAALSRANAGRVLLLTNPVSAGYTQNPISVYYCYSNTDRLIRCLAEVTNTPWGQRVTFAFDPSGSLVPKALHVSPMMDMRHAWCALTGSACAPGVLPRLPCLRAVVAEHAAASCPLDHPHRHAQAPERL